MIEGILGVAVFLVAGYVLATHRDRVRQLGAALTLGISAATALQDLSTDSEPQPNDDHESHPAESHWDVSDAGDHGSL